MQEKKPLISYKGKDYFYLEDFAKDYNVDTATIKDRYARGHRDPKALLHEGRIPFKFKGTHKIKYQGVAYPSLKDFCDAYKLNYRKALSLWKLNVRDPQEIRNKAVSSDKSAVLNQNRISDVSNIAGIINNHGYLTATQVSEKTGIEAKIIREQISRILSGQRNNMGVLPEDIIKVDYSEQELNSLSSNKEVFPNYAFSSNVVDHINQHLNRINDSNIKLIPFFNDKYYFDEQNNKVLSKGRSNHILKELTLSVDHYVFRDNDGKRYSFTVDTIKDLLKHPEITADDLLTRDDIIKKYNLPKNVWNNRHLYKILPMKIGHMRYRKNRKLVRGWTKDIVKQTVKKYPEKFEGKN